MKTLSIIIPTYNMEKYLTKCLDSLITEKFLDHLEILIVNDGSKDNSYNIALEYEKKYPNTFKVINKENGNYGSCINRGLKEATGKYIKILDADDSFNTLALEKLLETTINIDVDLIITDYISYNEKKDQIINKSYQPYPQKQIFNFYSFYTEKKQPIPLIPMHIITYKRDNILKINYQQTEGISYSDVEWTFIPITFINTAYYLNQHLYIYLLGREGQTVSPNMLVKNISSLKKLIFSLIKRYKENRNYLPLYETYLLDRIKTEILNIYLIYFSNRSTNITELIDFDFQIKELTPSLYISLEHLKINRYIKYISLWRKHKNNKLIYAWININIKLNQIINKLRENK